MADTQELDDEGRMPFVEHLRELRTRLRNAIIALLVGFGLAYGFKDQVTDFLLQPVVAAWQTQQAVNPALGDPSIIYTNPIDVFLAYLVMSLFAGLFLASPFIFHQVWLFIAPGLYKHERRYGIIFAVASAVCFIGGALFCYYMVLPLAFDFFLSYTTDTVASVTVSGKVLEVPLEPMWNMRDLLSFERKLLIGFGFVFELPLAVLFLSLVGAVTYRGLWRFNRWWIVLSFLLAAALTPPDVISQSMMAAPLIILYNISIGIAFLINKQQERKLAAQLRAEEEADRAERAARQDDDSAPGGD
ncbi:MAG: twin-arginine translocase subunit TatC [Myxococcota bacterium]